MQITGSSYNPWTWRFNVPGGAPESAGGAKTDAAAADNSTATGAGSGEQGNGVASAGITSVVQHFSALMQSIIVELQSNANGDAGAGGAQNATDATTNGGSDATSATTDAAATGTTAPTRNDGGNADAVSQTAIQHGRYHHWHTDDVKSPLSAADLAALQQDADALLNQLIGIAQTSAGITTGSTIAATDNSQSGNGTDAPAATTGTTADMTNADSANAGADTTAGASAAPAAPAASPPAWGLVARTFEQDLLQAMKAYLATAAPGTSTLNTAA